MAVDAMLQGFLLIADPYNIFLIFCGVLIGVLVGALPGLSSPMAVALLLPFTVGLQRPWWRCCSAARCCHCSGVNAARKS